MHNMLMAPSVPDEMCMHFAHTGVLAAQDVAVPESSSEEEEAEEPHAAATPLPSAASTISARTATRWTVLVLRMVSPSFTRRPPASCVSVQSKAGVCFTGVARYNTP